ncbi:aspartate/glutamate racemase family protein [Rhodococcus sp. IEGM 1408]|uniref:aspartate/glutamate racemase family protein n=1 Tax=Rhodococcus sp. IEGM 1408 TaxID=3082220 RepID=UPI002954CFE8|nr:aspartate/glutamate racemase family protein [Rhodococcus sp. IEGM 1408]MDV8001483.1 aspartate/glutamate racemase family protein [Rhodococcus sp. IEGM 1408]
MRLLVVNVNTTEAMTAEIDRAARLAASPGTEIVALTPDFGPASVEGNYESLVAGVAMCERVARYDQPYDGVVLAGYGDHGREALQEICSVPVIDITEASAMTAMLLGHRFGVVTTLDRTVPLIHDRLLVAGLTARCAGIRAADVPVLALENAPEASLDPIVEQARLLVEQDRAEVICLGCGGMAGLADRIRDELSVPVVDGVASAVAQAESLVRLGLTTSRVRTFAAPLPKHVTFPSGAPALRAGVGA